MRILQNVGALVVLAGCFMGAVLALVVLAYGVLLVELLVSAFLIFGAPAWIPWLLSRKPKPELVARRQASLEYVRWLKASGLAYSKKRHEYFEQWLEETNDRLRL